MAESTKATAKAKKDPKVKFKVIGDNKYLFVHHIKVQFRQGYYETSNEVEIEALRQLPSVVEIK